MNSIHLYFVFIVGLINNVKCFEQIDLKSNDLSHIESRLEELFSPRHIFEKLFNPEGVKGYEDIVKQCIDESKKDEDKCALTLCELFLTFADNKNAPIPSWAWKSKSQ